MKDQQEAERKKVTSQEIQQALMEQTKVINEKQASVMEDLAQVEPAVIEAQQGMLVEIEIRIGFYINQIWNTDLYKTDNSIYNSNWW